MAPVDKVPLAVREAGACFGALAHSGCAGRPCRAEFDAKTRASLRDMSQPRRRSRNAHRICPESGPVGASSPAPGWPAGDRPGHPSTTVAPGRNLGSRGPARAERPIGAEPILLPGLSRKRPTSSATASSQALPATACDDRRRGRLWGPSGVAAVASVAYPTGHGGCGGHRLTRLAPRGGCGGWAAAVYVVGPTGLRPRSVR
jgi:hypothetical protein